MTLPDSQGEGLEEDWRTGDPLIDEIREIRLRISARFDHDPVRLVEYYMELQERHRDRLLDFPAVEKTPGKSAAA